MLSGSKEKEKIIVKKEKKRPTNSRVDRVGEREEKGERKGY